MLENIIDMLVIEALVKFIDGLEDSKADKISYSAELKRSDKKYKIKISLWDITDNVPEEAEEGVDYDDWNRMETILLFVIMRSDVV